VRQVRTAHKAVEPDPGFPGEMVEQQRAPAEAIRAEFEPGAIGRERVEPAVPGLRGVIRNGVLQIVLAIIEDEFEAPVGGKCDRFGGIQIREIGRAVTIENTLEVALCGTGNVGAFRSCVWDRSTPAESSGL